MKKTFVHSILIGLELLLHCCGCVGIFFGRGEWSIKDFSAPKLSNWLCFVENFEMVLTKSNLKKYNCYLFKCNS